MDRKTCTVCRKQQHPDNFESQRLVCRLCRLEAFQRQTSTTYVTYLHEIFKTAKGRAKRRGTEFSINEQDLIDLWIAQNGRCALSGVVLTHHRDGSGKKDFNGSIDRTNNLKGYHKTNVQMVAYRVNIMKNTLPEDLFYWWVKTIRDFSCD